MRLANGNCASKIDARCSGLDNISSAFTYLQTQTSGKPMPHIGHLFETCVSRSLLISLICLTIGLNLCLGQEINLDSLELDSLQKVVEAEEIAALTPSDYAALIITVNDKYDPEIKRAQGIVFDTEIERLSDQFEDLTRLTEYVLNRANVLEGIKTLESKWGDQLDDVTDYADELESRTNRIIELKKELSEARAGWVSDKSALEYGEHPEEILGYVDIAIDTIDYYFEASAVVIDTFTVMYTDIVELLLGSREVSERLKGIRQSRLSRMMRERQEYIWNAGLFAGLDSMQQHWDYLMTTGVGDVRYYFKEHGTVLRRTLVWFIFFVLMFFWTRSRSLKLDDEEEPELVRNVHVLRQPFVMSVFIICISHIFQPCLLRN